MKTKLVNMVGMLIVTLLVCISCDNPWVIDNTNVLFKDPLIPMITISDGNFEMGKDGGGGDVTLVHDVTLTKSFKMSKYEVTQAQYKAVMGSLPNQLTTGIDYGRGDNYPVYYVSWYDALVFCNKLSIKEGLSPAYSISSSTDPATWGSVPTISSSAWDSVIIVSGSNGYRLPTEAQWEYAAKGGHASPNFIYSGSDTASDVAWHSGNSGGKSHEVGTKAPNELGIYNMSGNVSEWCWDWFVMSYPSSSPETDPGGPASGPGRVIRSGSYVNPSSNTKAVARDLNFPQARDSDIGLRIVRP